ncbi:polysaccharide pyruvyl transferase family protein [Microbacterium radiodurans]|uniref:Polysaccharide pyruvyl transferase family protein n=1 Tax=Microbacterium radiodurans TaxID=661398 RepID=A0A5J5IQC8_9MICO|nr:polysaccharide pyruvyl transferase family protein [Microbacterium radiodurans]KAA9084157.1 polysaccharide pyruvyl transferase family protein [Microbacterium radiodurans]
MADGPVVVAFNAGEMQLNRMFAKSYARHALLIARARRSGGYGVHAGMGIRQRTVLGRPIGAMLRLCDVVSWRDRCSRTWAGVGDVTADWAFAIGDGPSDLLSRSQRDLLAVSLRGDRVRPSRGWLDTVESVATSNSLTPTVIVQVERDNELATSICADRGWDISPWTGGAHATQEQAVRHLYRRSHAVISDRLHALVIGATEGAVPVAFAPSSVAKARRTLDAVGLAKFAPALSPGTSTDAAASAIGALLSERQSVVTSVERARNDLRGLAERLRTPKR